MIVKLPYDLNLGKVIANDEETRESIPFSQDMCKSSISVESKLQEKLRKSIFLADVNYSGEETKVTLILQALEHTAFALSRRCQTTDQLLTFLQCIVDLICDSTQASQQLEEINFNSNDESSCDDAILKLYEDFFIEVNFAMVSDYRPFLQTLKFSKQNVVWECQRIKPSKTNDLPQKDLATHDTIKELLNSTTEKYHTQDYLLGQELFDLSVGASKAIIIKMINIEMLPRLCFEDAIVEEHSHELVKLKVMKKEDDIVELPVLCKKYIKDLKLTYGLPTGIGQQAADRTTAKLDETSRQEPKHGEIDQAFAVVRNCTAEEFSTRMEVVDRLHESMDNKTHRVSDHELLNESRKGSVSIPVKEIVPEQQSSVDEKVDKCTSTVHSVAESSIEGHQELDVSTNDYDKAESAASDKVTTTDLFEKESTLGLHYPNSDRTYAIAASHASLLSDNPLDKLTNLDMIESKNEVVSERSQLSCHEESTNGIVYSNKDQEDSSESKVIVEYRYEVLHQSTQGFDKRLVEEGGCRIGSGNFGDVFHCRIPVTGDRVQDVAIKTLKQPKTSKASHIKLAMTQFRAELMAMTRCHHPNVVRLIGQCCEGPQLCLVYEFMSGDNLGRLIRKENPNPLQWRVRLKLMRDIACAIQYLHTICKPTLIHRDVKCANILISADSTAKLADFGLCISVDDEDDSWSSFYVTSAVGTRSYMAPEAFKGKVSPNIDTYSFGVILYEITTGLPSFSVVTKKDLVVYMRELERQNCDPAILVDPRAKWVSDVSSDLLKLSRWCTDYDSHSRPSMAVVVSILNMLMRDHLSHSEDF